MNKDTMQAFSCVPVEMQQKKQWVLWKLEERQNGERRNKKNKTSISNQWIRRTI